MLITLNSWISFVTAQFQLVVLHKRGKELQDNQATQLHSECWVATGLSRWVGYSDLHKDLGKADKV